jgi:uncharacterized protein YaaN involved in tellurite resistance
MKGGNRMNEKEAQKVLDELQGVRPEMLNKKAKRLFEAIMKIADERDELRETVERQNLEIISQKQVHDYDLKMIDDVKGNAVKLYKELEERDQIINAMAEYISKKEILVDKHCYVLTAEAVKQWFEKQIK